MRVAVTGGSGQLRRHVMEWLRASAHDVVNLDGHGERCTGWMSVDLSDHRRVVIASPTR